MSVAVMLQVLGWVSVAWMVTVHLLVQYRLSPDGMAYRIAGCAAAASVLAVSVAEAVWPVAVLGLLWLRTELFGHWDHVPERLTAPPVPSPARPRMPALLEATLTSPPRADSLRPDPRPYLPDPQVPTPHGANPQVANRQVADPHRANRQVADTHAADPQVRRLHLPHPHLDRRTVDRVFKVEMGMMIIIAVVVFGIWAEQQRKAFADDTNQAVCYWINDC